MFKRTQPAWSPPEPVSRPSLKLYNSLTRQKEEFIPQNGNQVLWYSCGPTVYDESHMGHARTYISFDILRRVLSNYFKYDVYYVMNITDIDDKIIKRARQNHFYENYIKENHGVDKVLSDIKCVIQTFEETVKNTNDPDKKNMYIKMLEKVKNSLEKFENVVKSNNEEQIKNFKEALLKESKNPLSDWLDKQMGGEISEHSIFSKLTQYFENDYFKDMDALNILKPNCLTRVSEYVPEIIAFIEKIIANGFAYESNGSVYFDVKAFDKSEKHYYAKLVPEAYGDTSSLQEGEGDLSISVEKLSEKRSPTDFALWKSSKVGEPWWDSPWGKGRPGWHIECSVMASAICGESLDIHTGGVDLKFPHHDNELAQAEAYFDNSHWVRYFLHSGHLTISGCKMSKSLKNFITIKDALKRNTARQLRFAFLLHSWKDTLDYSDATMDMAVQYEKFLNEFFLNLKCITRKNSIKGNNLEKFGEREVELKNKFKTAVVDIDNAMRDNIDTRTVLDIVRELVTSCNIYIKDCQNPNAQLLEDIATYITQLLTVFGVIDHNFFGFPLDSNSQNLNSEEIIMHHIDPFVKFRDNIRDIARGLKITEILKECDRLRDDVLPSYGIRLEDDDKGCRVKLVNKEELLKEREVKKQLEAEKATEKERKKAEAAAAAAAKEAQKKISPKEMFKLEKDKYSQFDENGLPTHDIEGKELSKGQLKKLQKLQQAQEKKYNEYLANSQNGA